MTLMYAEDTTLYCIINDANSDSILNNGLCKVSDWLYSNKLSLNVKKTRYMVFYTPQRRVIYTTLKMGIAVKIYRTSENVSIFKFYQNMVWYGKILFDK